MPNANYSATTLIEEVTRLRKALSVFLISVDAEIDSLNMPRLTEPWIIEEIQHVITELRQAVDIARKAL